MQSRQIPVIYVLSNGRSGSTLLDLLLGCHPDIWTVGEAQILPWELKENRAPCGCGKLVAECDFWQPILPEIPIDQGTYRIEHFREKHTQGRVLRWPLLPDAWRREVGSARQSAAAEYAQLNGQYLQVVWDSAEKRRGHPIKWLVDASKDPYRLLWLLQSGMFDLRIIHLVKDPRAFTYSMTKTHPGRINRTVRFAGRWLVENTHFAHLLNQPALHGKVMRIRYEDMATAPEQTLSQLGSWLGVDYSGVSLTDFRQNENHAVSGNPMRWRKTQIVLDEKWRNQLPSHAKTAAWAITAPLALRFNYR